MGTHGVSEFSLAFVPQHCIIVPRPGVYKYGMIHVTRHTLDALRLMRSCIFSYMQMKNVIYARHVSPSACLFSINDRTYLNRIWRDISLQSGITEVSIIFSSFNFPFIFRFFLLFLRLIFRSKTFLFDYSFAKTQDATRYKISVISYQMLCNLSICINTKKHWNNKKTSKFAYQ